MNSIASPPALPAREIVKSDDPELLELAEQMLAMDNDNLLQFAGEVETYVRTEQEIFQQRMRLDYERLAIARTIMLRRILASGGRAIAHEEYRCEISAKKLIEKRIDVLRALEGKVPPDELQKALYLTQPEPEWKADARVLNTIARKYGGEIAQIIAEGLVETFGPPQLIFEPKPSRTQNVTPIGGAK